MQTQNEGVCNCCGRKRSVYLKDGHDRECHWYEEVKYFQISDSEKLNNLMTLLEKNRSTLGSIYQEALEILTK